MLPPPLRAGEMQGRQGDQEQPRQETAPRGERQNRPPALILVLQQNGEGLTGTAESERGTVQIENGTIKGARVTLTLTMVGPDGDERVIRLQGYVDGDSMLGTMVGGPDGGKRGRGGGGRGPRWQAHRMS